MTVIVTSAQGIGSLPTELIYLIFSFAHALTIVATRKQRSYLEKPALPVLSSVLRVCALWYEIARNLPELWTYIPVLDWSPRTINMIDALVERSENLSLHIFWTIRKYNHILTPNDRRELQGIWNKAFSLIGRAASLHIQTTHSSWMDQCICFPTAPLLESLMIHLIGEGDNLRMLHLGPTPSLQSLVLHRVGMKESDLPAIVEHLEVLDAPGTPSLASRLADTFALSASSTSSLRHLAISTKIPYVKHDGGNAFRTYIGCLNTLTIGQLRHFGRLPSLLHCPLLEELSLTRLECTAIRDFMQGLHNCSIIFPALRTLRISYIEDTTFGDLRYLRVACPSLEVLKFNQVQHNPFMELLSADDDEQHPFWPKLHTLSFLPVDYWDICGVVSRRIEVKFPLARLEITPRTRDDLASLPWLQEHVPTLCSTTPSWWHT
ncbi:hypothetical protein R3P38DRAFT_3602247 [Favolaschia claudopus]|uniref:F-box domain-containing protein n=1 Tax=Favolaschia claudopus TaxID=2862362 RepID=A0AAW0ACM3_9AGAR